MNKKIAKIFIFILGETLIILFAFFFKNDRFWEIYENFYNIGSFTGLFAKNVKYDFLIRLNIIWSGVFYPIIIMKFFTKSIDQ